MAKHAINYTRTIIFNEDSKPSFAPQAKEDWTVFRFYNLIRLYRFGTNQVKILILIILV